jgi:hypothetical protein
MNVLFVNADLTLVRQTDLVRPPPPAVPPSWLFPNLRDFLLLPFLTLLGFLNKFHWTNTGSSVVVATATGANDVVVPPIRASKGTIVRGESGPTDNVEEGERVPLNDGAGDLVTTGASDGAIVGG